MFICLQIHQQKLQLSKGKKADTYFFKGIFGVLHRHFVYRDEMDTSSNEVAQGRDPDPEHIRLYYYKLDSAPIGNVQVKMLIRSN